MTDSLERPLQYPPISDVFIELLEEDTPLPHPSPETTEREDLYHAGARMVLDRIRWLRDEQRKLQDARKRRDSG